MALTANVLAADIHKRMVDDNRFGYSWAERHGAHAENWVVDGVPITIKVGDYDCSSSTITAWSLALAAFGKPNVLSGATFTGNMRYVFCRTGLFEWRTDFGRAQRGDLLLNEGQHVAMVQGGATLSEFSGNEFGGAYGGVRGDQTGREAAVNPIRLYGWDGYLHYIGKLTRGEEMTDAEMRKLAKMVVDELLNRAVAVNGEKKPVPIWELWSWTYHYVKQLFSRK